MNAYSDELRLLWTLLLNGGVFGAAYLFVRRRGTGGAIQAICDAFLLYFLTQYAAVAIPGVFGVFTAWTMTLIALVAAGLMYAGAGTGRDHSDRIATPAQRSPHTESPRSHKRSAVELEPSTWWTADRLALLACALFAVGYLLCYAWSQRPIPPVATDALVYHLPMAVQWIQTHRLGIYPSWYWNPAASYSPGTGSTFMAWWMAPAGNDVFVRYVQLPPLIFIFFIVARMCRLLGCSRMLSGLIAVGVTLSRPLFSEAIIPKDDLYVTAFVAAGVLALAREPMRDRFGPWRTGMALGLVLASKYTVLLACPVFLFLIDSPFKARWTIRKWLIAIALIAILALPWYVRNILLTGNPLFPVDVHLPGLTLHGLFTTERDQQLRSAAGVWDMLSGRYHSLPTVLIALLVGGWILACIVGWREILREPLARTCVIGSVATLLIFHATSPHHEVRYLFPLIVLLFVAGGYGLHLLARQLDAFPSGSDQGSPAPSPPYSGERAGVRGISREQPNSTKDPSPYPSPLSTGERGPETPRATETSPGSLIALLISTGVAISSAITSFNTELIASTAGFAASALLIAGIGTGLVFLQTRTLRLKRDRLALIGGCAAVVLAMFTYVNWHPYVQAYRETRSVPWSWPSGYPRQAELWKWTDDHVPPESTIAYANTYFVYPYYGFDLTRHVRYAPVRKDLHDFLHFPRMGERVPGDLLVSRMTEVMNTNPDRATWLENLRTMKADYLVVMKQDPDSPGLSADPPELKFAREDPGTFVPVAETDGGVVFRIQVK